MKRFCFALLTAAAMQLLHAQPALQWSSTFAIDSLSNEQTADLFIDMQGNIRQLIQSDEYLNPGNISRPVFRKLNASGNVLSSQVFTHGNNNDIHLHTMRADGAGNLYAAGYRQTTDANALYFWAFFKFDSAGNMLWEHALNLQEVESRAFSLLYDGGASLYISGYFIDSLYHRSNVVIKMDTGGAEVWRRYIACSNAWNLTISPFASGNNIVTACGDSLLALSPAGSTVWASDSVDDWNYNPPTITLDNQDNIYVMDWLGYTYRLTKYNPAGHRLWALDSIEFASGFGELNLQLITDSEGNVYAGSINRTWTTDTPFIYKISPQGAVIWATQLGYDPVSILYEQGKIFSLGNSTNGIWGRVGLQRLDAVTGNVDWTIETGDTVYTRYATLLTTHGAGSLLAASRLSAANSGYNDALLEKYEGALGIEGPQPPVQINLYPNPASTLLVIAGLKQGQEIALYNLQGKNILVTAAQGYTHTIDIAVLSNGFYIVKAGGAVAKFIKQ